MDNLWQPASFRGAPFFVESFERTGGRRGPNHEYPQKDDGYAEDTGGKIGEHKIEGYAARSVSDSDYAARRDALIAALEQEGPGELVHPAFGTVRVLIRDWSEKEGKTRLGMAVFSLSFVVANEKKYPTASKSPAARMPGLGSSAHRAAAAAFGRDFQFSRKSDFLLSSAGGSLGRFADLFSLICSMTGNHLDIDGILAAAMEALSLAFESGNPHGLADSVAAFPIAVTGNYEERHRSKRNADGTYRGIASLRGNGPIEPQAVTALYRAFDAPVGMDEPRSAAGLRLVEYANACALSTLCRRATVIEAARVAPFVNWNTLQDAETARDRIADTLEAEAWETTDDDLYLALSGIRSLVLSTVAPDNGRLPSLMDYRLHTTLPSLVLSHSLYGHARNADDLTSINGIRHPGFFPGGEPIRVLSNA